MTLRNRLPNTAFAVCAAATIAWAATVQAGPPPQKLRCPNPYFAREVRIEHQRLESDPRPERNPVVVANTWPEDQADGAVDRRYTVAVVCVRTLTDAEYRSEPYTDGGPPIGEVTR